MREPYFTIASGMSSLMTSVSRVRSTCAEIPVSPKDSDATSKPSPVLEEVREMDQIRVRIVDPNADVGAVEDFADLVADRVVDALDVAPGSKRRLHAFDDGKLGCEPRHRVVGRPAS